MSAQLDDERALRRREAALAKARAARARSAKRARAEREREALAARAWSKREAAAYAALQAEPTTERRRAWLRTCAEMPTTKEER